MTVSIRSRRDFLWLSGGATIGMLGAQPLFGSIRKISGGTAAPSGSAPILSALANPSSGRNMAAQGTVTNKKLLGILVDAARLPESIRYYRRVIEFCADWGLNTLQFRLTDDQGSALRFTSVPGLITHRNALTAEQLRSLVEYGRQHGIELIPEVESFGHTGYITRSPRYAHLLDGGFNSTTHFSGVIPVSPETLQLLGKLYREVADIFPSSYFHGGCDEVNWGGSAMSRRALQTKTRPQIWAEYLNSLNQICRSLGKDFIVWGDYVLHKQPEILGLLSKDIIVMDWNYQEIDPVTVHEPLLKLQANGSRGIGAPALQHSGWGPRVGTEQLRNIDAYAESYLGSGDPGSLGVILTNWVPTAYLQNSIWDGWAYAAVAFTCGVEVAQTSGFRRFTEKHYASEWNETWSEVYQIVYATAPPRRKWNSQDRPDVLLPVPWSADEELTQTLKTPFLAENPFTRLRSLLVLVEPLVRTNLPDFQSFALSVEYLERLFWRNAVVRKQAMKVPLDRQSSALLIRSIAERDRSLAEALSRDWDQGRPANSSGRTMPIFDFGPKAQLLYQWNQAAAYSASLAANPDRFYDLLGTAKSG